MDDFVVFIIVLLAILATAFFMKNPSANPPDKYTPNVNVKLYEPLDGYNSLILSPSFSPRWNWTF